MIENVLINFLLFGFVENIIVVYFFIRFNNLKIDIKKNILILGVLVLSNLILKLLIPPPFFQIMFILYTSLILMYFYNLKLKQSIMSIAFIVLIMLITEIIPAIISQFIFSLDFIDMNTYQKFILLTPARILDIFIIYHINKIKEVVNKWAGFGLAMLNVNS